MTRRKTTKTTTDERRREAESPGVPPTGDRRLDRQLRFLLEIDRLKHIGRQSYLTDGRRKENAAEHSWHVAVMALILSEYADESVDRCRVIGMLLIHDVVEIDAGDTYFYDQEGLESQEAREQAAAERLFGLLPAEQRRTMHALWQEYERGETADARFARSLDRLMPLLHNVATGGRSWREHGVDPEDVRSRIRPGIEMGCARFWEYADRLIAHAVQQDWFSPE